MLIPQSLLKELREVKGFDEVAFVAAHQLQSPTSVRINRSKDIGLFATNEKVPWCDGGVYLPERPVFTLDPAYHAGAYYVQEASSMFLDHILRSVLRDKKGIRVLDLCAAPGGKSTLIASLLDKDSLLISNEVIRTRASILDENMTRWGHMNTWVTSNDPRDFTKLEGYFDVIVVDAPCSGSGLWRKDEKALNEWSEANIKLCSDRQERILADIWPTLKEDGLLIYATCSYSRHEDENILDRLSETYDVAAISVEVNKEWNIVQVDAERLTGYRFFPDKVKGEGFFIAAVQKKESAGEPYLKRFKTQHEKKIQQQAGHLLKNQSAIIIPTGQGEYGAILPVHEADLHLLQQAVYMRKTGLQLGMPSAKEWIPAHEVALSIDAGEDLPTIQVNREQALKFLKREDMSINETAKGWHIIRYDGLGLGWVKALGNRINNYLPKQWRIRMDIE